MRDFYSFFDDKNGNGLNATPKDGKVAQVTTPQAAAILIPDDVLLGMYSAMMLRLNVQYLEGALGWLAANKPDLNCQITSADDLANEVWSKCNKGELPLSAFDLAVYNYEQLVNRGIEAFKQSKVTSPKATITGYEPCVRCGKKAARYTMGILENKFGMFCLECEPYPTTLHPEMVRQPASRSP